MAMMGYPTIFLSLFFARWGPPLISRNTCILVSGGVWGFPFEHPSHKTIGDNGKCFLWRDSLANDGKWAVVDGEGM